jgi:hypothetical protein
MTVRVSAEQADAISALETAVNEETAFSISGADIQRRLLDVALDQLSDDGVEFLGEDVRDILRSVDWDDLDEGEREVVVELADESDD